MSVVPPTSPMAALKAKLEKAREERYEDIPLKDAPEVVVRYAALQPEDLQDVTDHWKRAPREGRDNLVNADICARSCIGIYELVDGELRTSGDFLNGGDEPLTFDTIDLVPEGDPVHQVMALYPLKGDYYGISRRIMRLSGFSDEDASLLGE